MVFTPRDELERVPSFTEQLRSERGPLPGAPDTSESVRVCDSCGEPLDPVEDLHRTRHRDCPPPPIPSIAREALERLRAKKAQR